MSGRLHGGGAGSESDRDLLYSMHAEICKALAHPKRLEMLDLLSEDELAVEVIAEHVGLQKSNVSQHLAVLRRVGLVATRKEGLYVYYRLADQRITGVCNLLREILVASIRQEQKLIGSLE